MVEIAPSILAADFTRLGEQIAAVEEGGAAYVHVDVMDGHFVPNITVGPFIVQAVRRITKLPIDCHLMIEDPDKYIGEFARAGANMISVHPEATSHLHRTIGFIRQAGCRAGVVLNPATPLSAIEEIVKDVDYVLLMSVNPGFGGQQFIMSSLNKLQRLRALLQSCGSQARIEIDGGISAENAAVVAGAGAEILVAGSAIFGQASPAKAVQQMLQVVTEAQRV
ncbi:MAG: ribulose-phosphate 3-epimerase [Acidobacteria bacterium]|nr:ribulose-phosphate 3-epimerase [Acidobacteriota bacterium]